MFLDFYVAVLYDLRFAICSSYAEQVWPPLVYIATLQSALQLIVVHTYEKLLT